MPGVEKKTPIISVLAENQAREALDFLKISGRSYGPEDIEKLMSGFTSGMWRFVTASVDGHIVGCFYLNRTPKYRVYQALKVPELQDLRVLPDSRRQGIGRTLVEYGEAIARDLGAPGLGMSVGLSPDYGAAQRLYADMGYLPDGNGITYDREPVAKGQRIALDDDACLMLIKLWG
ncbi:MAG TPA: GNAT family N-acetyltransferase [Alphaproteobacteria bacterium]